MMLTDETIAAIASGMGEAGVGVIRISGSAAIAVGSRAFHPKRGRALTERRTHTIAYGWVVGKDGEKVDEALALLMRGPSSFTGEDVVELHCHGGQVAVRRVLEAVLAAGARLAEPGEFTRRAFLNGRMDLAQAEAVIDVIRSKTDQAMAAAVRQLRGDLGQVIADVRERLLEMTAHLEADIDFPELELEVQTFDQVVQGCEWSLEQLGRLMSSARQGKLLRDGFRVVLAGRPNVGKSSLLNRLVRENRAIVTAVPGTTRDVIEEWVNLNGLPVLLADTAGIRDTEDVVERMGVDRSRAMLDRADLILVVIDGSEGYTREDAEIVATLPAGIARMVLINKIDLTAEVGTAQIAREVGAERGLAVSAETGAGLAEVEEAIVSLAGLSDREEQLVANARQEEAIRRAAGALRSALEGRRAGFGSDLISIDIRAAWVALGEVTGETVGEDLLDQIFSRFCIGK